MDFEGWKPQSTHMGIMADLLKQDGIAQQDLAISTIKDKGTITRGLQGLEKEGLLKRQVNPADRRNKLIFLTEKGRCLHSIIHPCVNKTMDVATKGVKEAELDKCIDVLHRIYLNLQENINPTSKIDEPGN
jgi:DNA-binding MarR family transcriptional regulator